MQSLTHRWQVSLCTHSCVPHAKGGDAGHSGEAMLEAVVAAVP